MDRTSLLPRFTCNGTRIGDRFPEMGSDGYVGHCSTPEAARAETDERNRQWAEELEERYAKGEEFHLARDRYHYFWGKRVAPVSYVD